MLCKATVHDLFIKPLLRTGVPNLSLTMFPFSISGDEHVPLKFVPKLGTHGLDQGSPNYGPRAKSGPRRHFVKN